MKKILSKKSYFVAGVVSLVFISAILAQKGVQILRTQPKSTEITKYSGLQNKQLNEQSDRKAGINQIQDKEPELIEYEKVQERVRMFRESKDLNGLVQLSEEVRDVWEKKSAKHYAGLMYEICGAMASQDFRNKEQYIFAKSCVKKALEKAEKIPIEWEVKLVPFLGGNIEYVLKLIPEEKWSADRTERMNYWCHAWQRLEKATEYINDSETPPVYRSDLTAEERKKVEKYYQQRFLLKDKSNFGKEFRKFVIWAYTKPPYNTTELESFLNKYVKDVGMLRSILAEVEQKILESQRENQNQ